MTGEAEEHDLLSDGGMRLQFFAVMKTLPSRPIATLLIIAANIAVFGVMVAAGVDFLNPKAQTLLEWGADFGPRTLSGEWWRMITCMFLHFGIIHLGMNMLVLWGLGRLAERLVGSIGFAIAYLISGIVGSIVSLAWNPHGISAGASGAVFGAAGVLLGFVMLRRDTVPPEVRNQLLKSMAKFLMLNAVIGISVARVDMAAHLGGFAGGLFCGLILSQPLSFEILAKRKFRNLATIMAACVVLPIGITALPAAPPDMEMEMQRLKVVEQEIYDRVNDIQDLAAKHAISDEEFADEIQSEVLPRWARYREDIEGLSKLKYADEDYFSRLLGYIECRETSWQVLLEGLRAHDRVKLKQFRELTDQANKWFADH